MYGAQGHEEFYKKVAECVPDENARLAIAEGVKKLHARCWHQLCSSVEGFESLLTPVAALAAAERFSQDETDCNYLEELQALRADNEQLRRNLKSVAQELQNCDKQEENLRLQLSAIEPRSVLGPTLGNPAAVDMLRGLAEDARIAQEVIDRCKVKDMDAEKAKGGHSLIELELTPEKCHDFLLRFDCAS